MTDQISHEALLQAAATSTDEAGKVAELRAAIPATTAGIYLNAGALVRSRAKWMRRSAKCRSKSLRPVVPQST